MLNRPLGHRATIEQREMSDLLNDLVTHSQPPYEEALNDAMGFAPMVSKLNDNVGLFYYIVETKTGKYKRLSQGKHDTILMAL